MVVLGWFFLGIIALAVLLVAIYLVCMWIADARERVAHEGNEALMHRLRSDSWWFSNSLKHWPSCDSRTGGTCHCILEDVDAVLGLGAP